MSFLPAATIVDDAAFTPAVDRAMIMAGFCDEIATDEVNEGDAGAVRMSVRRAQKNDMDTAIRGEDGPNDLLGVSEKRIAANTYSSVTGVGKRVAAVLETGINVKATAGNLYRGLGVIDKNAPTLMYYVQFIDAAAMPADGVVTHILTPIPVNHTNGVDSTFDTGLLTAGLAAALGINIFLSSTLVQKTVVAAAGVFLFSTVDYR